MTLARTPELVDLAHIEMRKDVPLPSMIVYPDPPLSDEERELIPALNLGIEVICCPSLRPEYERGQSEWEGACEPACRDSVGQPRPRTAGPARPQPGQTVAALATVSLLRRSYCVRRQPRPERLYLSALPDIAQAYATAATRASRPPFVHYVAAYLAQDGGAGGSSQGRRGSFAEIRLVDSEREVTSIITSGSELVCRSPQGERRLKNVPDLQAFVAELPRRSAGPPADLDAMREAMEDDVSARIVLGGAVTGYSGNRYEILQETLLALQKGHPVYLLGGFGGAARDAAIALGLLQANDALAHDKVGPGYQESIAEISAFAASYRSAAQASGSWDDLVAASKAEDQEGRPPGV